jgi:integrase
LPSKILERAKGFEPSTPTLASLDIPITFINDAERFGGGNAEFHWISAVFPSHSFTRPHAPQQRFCVTPAAGKRYPRGYSMPRLTPLTVERTQPKAARQEIPDSVTSGLYFIVQPSGVKSWAVRYRFDRKPWKYTLGRYPAVELGPARDLAKAALEAVDKGINPALGKKATRPTRARPEPGAADAEVADIKAEDLTRESPVRDVWKGYLKVHLIPEATASSVERFKGIFEKHVLPKWRDRQIAGIVKADALTVIDAALLRGQSAKNSAITVLSSFFNWCMDRNLIEHSPVERVKKIKMKSRKRKLSDDEIRIFWEGCDALGSLVKASPSRKKPAAQFGKMFQLLLLTGCRRTEVAEIARDEVNFKNRIWTIPGERTKTKEEHQVYLCDAALAILMALPRVAKVQYFFSTTGKSPSSGFSKAKKRLDKLAVLPHYTLHDLRRSFDTGCARIGIRNEVIERCLNHSLGVYNRHDYEKEMADAWMKWGTHLAGLVRGNLALAA